MITQCAECGDATVGDVTCLDCFHALLAFENERPEAFGAVHHLTVACYFLQHPAGYGADILTAWQDVLAAGRAGTERPRELQRRMGRRFGGTTKVRDATGQPPDWWPRAWTMHIRNVLTPGDAPTNDEYITRARRWATETLCALERARSTGD